MVFNKLRAIWNAVCHNDHPADRCHFGKKSLHDVCWKEASRTIWRSNELVDHPCSWETRLFWAQMTLGSLLDAFALSWVWARIFPIGLTN